MKRLFKFTASWGRYFDYNGIVIVTQEQLDYAINNKLTVYFGEIAGKYSEVYYTFDKDDFEIITDDVEKIEWVEKNLRYVGYNPFDVDVISDKIQSLESEGLICEDYINIKLNESRIN